MVVPLSLRLQCAEIKNVHALVLPEPYQADDISSQVKNKWKSIVSDICQLAGLASTKIFKNLYSFQLRLTLNPRHHNHLCARNQDEIRKILADNYYGWEIATYPQPCRHFTSLGRVGIAGSYVTGPWARRQQSHSSPRLQLDATSRKRRPRPFF